MRKITVKYSGVCQVCENDIPEGVQALYERGIGLICLDCGEPEPDKLRNLRNKARERKAEKLETRADKNQAESDRRAQTAMDIIKHIPMGQPILVGHHSERRHRRDLKRHDQNMSKAIELSEKAKRQRKHANRLRDGAQVKGDADRKRDVIKERIKPLLKVGMKVNTPWFNDVTIKRLNPKSVTIETASGYTERVCYSWIEIIKGDI